MLIFCRLFILGAYIYSTAASENLPDVDREISVNVVENRAVLSTVGLACQSGASCSIPSAVQVTSSTTQSSSTTKTSTSKTAPITTAKSLASSSSTPSSTTSIEPTHTGYVLALTTTFTQPAACTDGFSAIAAWGTDIWENAIDSEVGLSYTSCFPSQFYSSILATTTLAPFSPLICPYTWETYPLNDTYIICCPKGFGVYVPEISNTERPGLGSICTSILGAYELLDITSYDSTGGSTIVPTSASENGTIVFAEAFDGIAPTPFNTSTFLVPSQTIEYYTTSFTSTLVSASPTASSVAATSTSKSSAPSKSIPTCLGTSICILFSIVTMTSWYT